MAVYEFNTALLQDIRKCVGDIVSFVDNAQATVTFTRWEVDGRRMTSGTVQFTTNIVVPDNVLYGLDVFAVQGAPVPTYELTTGFLASFRKCTDDILAFFDNLSGAGVVIQTISFDGRALTNGVVAVTTNSPLSATAVFGLDVTRTA